MHYLFVHGSWHGMWCWEKLIPYLHHHGHTVSLFDLPGSGDRFSEINDIDFATLLNCVEEQIMKLDEPVSIVAHSFAGLLVAPLAEKYVKKINKIFYLAAWLPREGKSLVDMAMAYNNSELPSIFINSDNPQWTTIDPEGAKDIFYHDCTEQDKVFASQLIKPKNKIPDHTPQNAVNPEQSLKKSVYVLCTKDKVVHPSSQRDMAKHYGFSDSQIIEFPTGHSPFLANPGELANILCAS